MVADTTRVTHAGRGNDYLWLRIKVDIDGFVAGYGKPQTREGDRVDSLLY